jgi:hypothetical protein
MIFGGQYHRQDNPETPGSDGASPYLVSPRPTLSALRHFADALCPVLGYGSMRFD